MDKGEHQSRLLVSFFFIGVSPHNPCLVGRVGECDVRRALQATQEDLK